MRITYTNHIDTATLSASSAVIGNLIENTQDQRLGVKWISGATATNNITATLTTSANSVQCAAIIGHTITTSATITINANSSNTWTSPLFSTSMSSLGADRMIIKYFSSAQNYKYWRYTITGQSSIEAGRLWLGPYSQIDPESTNKFTVNDKRSDNVKYGKNRQKFSTPGSGWREINLTFPPSKVTAVNVIRTIYSTVGNHSSFIFCNFDDIRTYPIVDPMYCSIVGPAVYKHRDRQRFEYNLNLEEDL